MGDLIKSYNDTLVIENDNPVEALTKYTTDLINIEPTTSKEFQEGLIVKNLFFLGYFLGLLADIFWSMELSLGWKIVVLIFAPFIQGLLAIILFSGFANMIVNVDKLTKSEKYWVALLGYIGAARCAIRINEPGKAEGYAAALKKFGLNIMEYLSDGLIALAQHDYVKAEHALSLAAHDQTQGLYSEHIADAIYRCVMLHPKKEQVIRSGPGSYPPPPPPGYQPNVQHVHGDVVYGKQDIRVQDSVVNRSKVGSDAADGDTWE